MLASGPTTSPLVRWPNAQITVRRDDLSFETNSATGAPRRVSSRSRTSRRAPTSSSSPAFDHRPASKLVTVAAGEAKDLGQIPLKFRPGGAIPAEASIKVSVVDGKFRELDGATVTVRNVSTSKSVRRPRTLTDESETTFTNMAAGTYDVTGTADGYDPDTKTVSVGPSGTQPVQLVLVEQGQAMGRVVDALSPPKNRTTLSDYDITIRRVTRAGLSPAVGPPLSPTEEPRGSNNWVWSTPVRALLPGHLPNRGRRDSTGLPSP